MSENEIGKRRNKEMKTIFKNHLCLHCKNLNYYDWYYCNIRDDFDKIYTRKEIEKYNNINFENSFIPETPITECENFIKNDSNEPFWCE